MIEATPVFRWPPPPTECPLWVKSRHVQCKTACPLYPRKRTLAGVTLMSALCQKRTYAQGSYR